MHELALAWEILALVERHIPPDRAPAVRVVHVRVGELAGVVAASLEFCFDAIVAGTAWQHATLAVERVPSRASCRSCGAEFPSATPGAGCPRCGSGAVCLIAGSELHVDAVEVDDDEAPAWQGAVEKGAPA